MNYIKKFEDIQLKDIPQVGGKNASLGEMIRHLSGQGLRIPTGFATTADAYWHFITANNLLSELKRIMNTLPKTPDTKALAQVGSAVRALILNARMPDDLAREIVQAYQELSAHYQEQNLDVAVRSSATAEDLPNASFAGQQESYVHIHGEQELLDRWKRCIASLFTDRAIAYRIDKGFDHFAVALSVGVQKMVRSDKACAGVTFSLDTESGFKDVVIINGSYGLGESVVAGEVTPDEFRVFKPTLAGGHDAIIGKKLGVKNTKRIYSDDSNNPVVMVPVSEQEQQQFCLTDAEILELARMTVIIETYYTGLKKEWSPMDVEWAKDGNDGLLYIVQARPETVYAHHDYHELIRYELDTSVKKTVLVTGQSIGDKIVSGPARIVRSIAESSKVQQGDILVTEMTDPDWVPVMKKVAGIVTVRGGRTCHAAIVSRELGIPAIVGASNALDVLADGQQLTLDCSAGARGVVYAGAIPFKKTAIKLTEIPKSPVTLMITLADPDSAFALSFLPVDGVGLARIEFVVSNAIKVHPMALIEPTKITDAKIKKEIDALAAAYPDKKQFFIDTLAYGIGTIAAAFYPKPVIVRTSDFKSNEYRNLLGGSYFELEEENPMLGLRGASRYIDPSYKPAFALECAALTKVRERMGLTNVIVMLPFVRTVAEARAVIALLAEHGLRTGAHDLKLYMMCEVPSNVLLMQEFSTLFDGFSIGSNDLTQLTLGIDRDSPQLAPLFDERDAAVKQMMQLAVKGAHQAQKPIGICGQAPSDYPEIADFLIDAGIDSISLNPDSVLPFLMSTRRS
ncbi:MAG: phosphoenolpyruvate synthase [Candidatus Babeliales bacterium]